MGLENRHDEGSVSIDAVSGARGGRWGCQGRLLGTLEAVLGHGEAVRAPPLHQKMHALVCTLLESFRPPPPPAGASGTVLVAWGLVRNETLEEGPTLCHNP